MIKIRLGEVGKVLKFYIQDDGAVKDLSGYTGTLRIKGPDGRVQADRSTSVTAATGLVSYTTVAGDWAATTLNTIGTYTYQIKLNISTTSIFYTHTGTLKVVDNFTD